MPSLIDLVIDCLFVHFFVMDINRVAILFGQFLYGIFDFKCYLIENLLIKGT
jgi:hypothetical protein